MKYIEILTAGGDRSTHISIGMCGFRVAANFDKGFRKNGKAKVHPNAEGWTIRRMSGELLANVREI